MLEIIQIVLSIFGLVGIGYACIRLGYLSNSVGDGLSEFVQKVAVPVLLARTMANAEFSGISPWAIWAAYFGGVVVVWVAAHLMVRHVFGRDARAGVVAGLSTAFANTVLIGIPLTLSTYGEAGLVYILIIVSVHLPTMLGTTMVLYEWGNVADGVASAGQRPSVGALLWKFATRLATNPIIIALMVGLAMRFTGIKPAGTVALVVDSLAGIAGPVALLSVGIGLSQYGMARQLAPAAVLAVLKLLVMPAVVLLLAVLVGLPPTGIAVAVLTAACPTGVTAYIIAGQFGTGQALASNALAISTAAAVVTVGVWLLIVQSFTG